MDFISDISFSKHLFYKIKKYHADSRRKWQMQKKKFHCPALAMHGPARGLWGEP